MNKQLTNRFPKATTGCLALMLIAIAALAGYGTTHATANTDLAPASQPLPKADLDDPAAPPVKTTESSDELIWVRQEPAVVNVNDDPIRIDATEPRFEGSFTEYTVNETDIAMETRYVDHGNEGYHVTIKSVFDRPPIVLNPPLRYKIKVSFSHGGTHNWGGEGMGAQFWYSADWGILEPSQEVLAYYPWHPDFKGPIEKDWMVAAPPITHEGQTFNLYASWWNCPPCNITWTYRAERANAVERLGVEVVKPVVTYQGVEVPPGETYFPETCPDSTRLADDSCSATHVMKDGSVVSIQCLQDQERRLLLVLDSIEFSVEHDGNETLFKKAILQIAAIKLAKNCIIAKQAGEGYRLDLTLEEGAIQLSNAAGGLTTSVGTSLGTATTAAQGAFSTGYDPDNNVAVFGAYSTPLTLQSKAGAKKVLQPYQQVKLTSSGFGPVTQLPHFFLPVMIKK